MPAIIDVDATRRFTKNLKERRNQCDNGEGMICNSLEDSIKHYVALCEELRKYVNQWARSVFTGETDFDEAIEALLKEEMRALLVRAKRVATLGRSKCDDCDGLEGLDRLHHFIADFDDLLENWVSPERAVGPAARVKMPVASEQQIAERLKALPALPKDWQPSNWPHETTARGQQ